MADLTAQKAYLHLKAGSVKGISFGFTLPPHSSGKVTYDSDGTRRISELFLHECSLVAVPANPLAQVVNVKTLGQVERLLLGIRSGDLNGDTLAQLRGIDLALKALLKKDDACTCQCDVCTAGNCADCTDECAECEGNSCEGCVATRQDAAKIADALKGLSLELKKLVT